MSDQSSRVVQLVSKPGWTYHNKQELGRWGLCAAHPMPCFTPLAFNKGESLHYKAVFAEGVALS